MSQFKKFIPLSANGPVRKAVLPDFSQIPTLAHGLEQLATDPGKLGTLFKQPPEAGSWFGPIEPTFKYDPRKRKIGSPDDFSFDSLPAFTPPSADPSLREQAKKQDCWLTGSTSSVTPLLSQLSILTTNYQPLYFPRMSRSFKYQPMYYTRAMLEKPVMTQFSMVDGVCAIDKLNKPNDKPNILSQLGHVLEKYLTTECDDFKDLLAKTEHEKAEDGGAFSYLKMGDCLFRSQLDCFDPKVGVFDIKTRATAKIRYNIDDYKTNLDVSQITSLKGLWGSYEREYYDLIRSKFLAFSHQLRIGGMHGLLCAYHNTDLLQGFQYISLEEIDKRVFGSTQMADHSFAKSTELLSKLMGVLREQNVDLDGDRIITTLVRAHKTNYLDIYLAPQNVTPEHKFQKFRLELSRTLNGMLLDAKAGVDLIPDDDFKVSFQLSQAEFKSKLLTSETFLENDALSQLLLEETRHLNMTPLEL